MNGKEAYGSCAKKQTSKNGMPQCLVLVQEFEEGNIILAVWTPE